MIDLDENNVRRILSEITALKRKGILRLCEHFKVSKKSIFYDYMKGRLPDKGSFDDGTIFMFHGLGCSIKNETEGWKTEIEFGPGGAYYAFDKYTLCHQLGFPLNKCDDVISILEKSSLIRLADEKLYSLTGEARPGHEFTSENEEIDASVADRYVFLENTR